ncbi:MAG TPA: DUF4139 domain-containing protein, partial [Anaeromyxobacteraceae bacterium]|nr:DUF4139 domain-containing protein [Anaeromyxobacteraceae bacterium]
MRKIAPILLLAAACAHGPGVSSEQLPLRRVVVYRNGVGYFERAGTVKGDRVEFRVRPAHFGDFLATLAVVERGGSSVRAASFPIRTEDKATPGAPGGDAKKAADALETVVLELDGEKHDLAVGYVIEQPLWRPSYRLVLGKEGPTLQAWGIVQNLSGEDWRDVSLSLVAGAPIAFQATLGTAVIPRRPVVSDTGELISAVPRSETTLAQAPRAMAPSPPSASMSMPAPAAAPAPMMEKAARSRAAKKELLGALGQDAFADEAPLDAAAGGVSMPRDMALLANMAVEAGTTRYDLPSRVTVPRDSATMVLLLARPVPGEAVHLFAPDAGVPDSSRHPFRVARFKNPTRGLFEKGPIAVFEAGAFLGQGVLEPLAAGGEATVPFALERAVAVDSDRKGETRDARLARIETGRLTLERDQVQKTIYRLRNGSEAPVKLVVRHARVPGMRLVKPPDGTEDQVGKGTALVPVTVAAAGSGELIVEERRAFQTGADWLSPEADEAVKGYLADPRADAKVAGPLAKAWEIRKALVGAQREQEKLQGEREILSTAAEEAREGLRAISRNTTGVEELRRRLAGRLGELEEKLARIAKRLVELELQVNEQRVALQDALQAIKLAEP